MEHVPLLTPGLTGLAFGVYSHRSPATPGSLSQCLVVLLRLGTPTTEQDTTIAKAGGWRHAGTIALNATGLDITSEPDQHAAMRHAAEMVVPWFTEHLKAHYRSAPCNHAPDLTLTRRGDTITLTGAVPPGSDPRSAAMAAVMQAAAFSSPETRKDH